MTGARFSGRAALITGAAGGIGSATARRLAAEGARIVLSDVSTDVLEPLAQELGAVALAMDVTEPSQVRSGIEHTAATLGRLDVLVNAAGVLDATPIDQVTPEQWDRIMAINLRGTFLCAQDALRVMCGQRHGAIVNISSFAGDVGGLVTGASYAASKAGVSALTKSLAKFAAPFGVRVNAVSPGTIDTAMTAQLPVTDRHRLVAAIPLGRMGRPEEIGSAVAFLASDDASFVTGAILHANGGAYM